MYAVIRAGGKQYRVSPGDVIRVETQDDKDGKVQFSDVLAVSAEAGSIVTSGATRQRERRDRRTGTRREDPGLPLQAQEAVQEAARTPAELQRGAHHRDCL